MGAIYIVKRVGGSVPSGLGSGLREGFARQGFGAPTVHHSRDWEVGFYDPLVAPTSTYQCTRNGHLAVCAGALVYRDLFGSLALPLVLADYLEEQLDWSALRGSFAVVVVSHDRVSVLGDPMGTFHIFADRDWQAISTSFLALAAALPKRTIDEDAVYDYVFQGAPHGGHTVLREIRLCESGAILELGDRVSVRRIEWKPPDTSERDTLEDHARRCIEILRDRIQPLVEAFGDRIDTALSGGYDSRLILALLRSEGLHPRLHVYGRNGSPDVRIAKAIADGEVLDLEWVDKEGMPPVPLDAFPEVVERNFLAFDGYPTDGIFDMGADLATRRRRCSSGELMLNGGGGEIFRNFFYLPGRRFTLRELVWSFYSRFDPTMCTTWFDERAYIRCFEDKLARTLGITTSVLSRIQVEMVYPDFRCRFWTGRNNSINNRLGLAMTPFLDPVIVNAALATPVKYKNVGRLEARLITLADARLASYSSVYGHTFDRPPTLQRQVADLAARLRPPFLRRFSYRLRHRISAELPRALSREYVVRTIGNEFGYMRRFFVLDKIRDVEQYNRICTLEYMFQKLSALHDFPVRRKGWGYEQFHEER